MLSAWFGVPAFKQATVRGKQIVEAEGHFQLDDEDKLKLDLLGRARCESVTLRDVPFDSVEGAFAWNGSNIYVRDLKLTRPDGKAEGKFMIENKQLRVSMKSTLPVPVYRPFVVGVPLEKILANFSERKGAAIDLTLEGGVDLTSKLTRDTTWAYRGSGAIKNMNYRGVPVNSADCRFSVSHPELVFSDGTVIFNYENYPLCKAFNGPNDATAKVGRIRYISEKKIVEIEDVRGAIWAAPMTRFFAPAIADTLEVYRFHQPPDLRASGVVDVTPQGRTALDISFASQQPANYIFLGQDVKFNEPSGKVAIRGSRTTVSDLKLQAFDGETSAEIRYLGNGKLTGDVSWTHLSLDSLATTYGFEVKAGGNTTGRIDFSISNGKTETMNGEGLIAIQKAELFTVPMFGPLTPLIGGVTNDEKAGRQRAKSAFCTYTIQSGVLKTNDFQTSTTSLNFTGDGMLNLNDRTFDMNMRMNARGLLSVITLPLFPFQGFFNFTAAAP
ncbi:MAG: AsmA-like C-terminal region-containing protein [Akkermansiaceae bacterium]|nr:AsmA-like C-terminal region-containing protein [Akkermansiaceae bacterium]